MFQRGGSCLLVHFCVTAPVCIMLGQMFTVRQVIITGGFIGFVGMSLGSLLFSMEYVIATFGICFGGSVWTVLSEFDGCLAGISIPAMCKSISGRVCLDKCVCCLDCISLSHKLDKEVKLICFYTTIEKCGRNYRQKCLALQAL